jgi:hypothetical protein
VAVAAAVRVLPDVSFFLFFKKRKPLDVLLVARRFFEKKPPAGENFWQKKLTYISDNQ